MRCSGCWGRRRPFRRPVHEPPGRSEGEYRSAERGGSSMTWNDDDLMAYADGELQSERCAALERAMAADETLRARVAQLQAQRTRVAAAFAPVLDEPMPERLSALLRQQP